MTNTEIKTSLQKVVNTLNTVEVKGEDNLNHLLGSIYVLKQLIANMDAPEITLEEVKTDAEDSAD